jgi:hypothetical protein
MAPSGQPSRKAPVIGIARRVPAPAAAPGDTRATGRDAIFLTQFAVRTVENMQKTPIPCCSMRKDSFQVAHFPS